MRLIKSLIWLFTGCPLYFAGISAGTAAALAVGVGGAVASGVAGSSAAGAGKKASWQSYMQQLSGLQNASNAMHRNATITRDENLSYNGNAYNMGNSKQQEMYLNSLKANDQTAANNTLANAQALGYGTNAINGSYDSMMSGNQGALDSAMAADTNQAKNYNTAFNGINGYMQPYMDAGTSALSKQQDLMGMNGVAAQNAQINMLQGGEYQALAKQGENSLLQNAAATGGVRGGNTAAALEQLRPQMMQQLINTQNTNYGNMASQGQQAGTTLAGYRSDLGNQLAGVSGAQGQQLAQYNTNRGQYGAEKASSFGGLKTQNANTTRDINNAQLANKTDLQNNNSQVTLANYLAYMGGNRDANIGYSNGTNGYDAGLYMQQGGAAAQQAQTSGGYNQAQILGIGNAIGQGMGALGGIAANYYGNRGSYGNYGGGGNGYGNGSGQSWGVPQGYSGGGGYGFSGLR
jgi:hypothetical protein